MPLVRYFHKPSKTYRQRRQRLDHPILVASVISVPDDWRYSDQRWSDFKQECLLWLDNTFGEARIASVIEHLDEKCMHMHVFLVPLEGEDVVDVHPGLKSLVALKASSSSPAERRSTYRKAMSNLLDSFHRDVGGHFGLVRKHNNARRMTRAQWHVWKWYRERERRREEAMIETQGITVITNPSDRNMQERDVSVEVIPMGGCDASQILSAVVPIGDVQSGHSVTVTPELLSALAPLGQSLKRDGFLASKSNRGAAKSPQLFGHYEPRSEYSWVRPSQS
jgi:hypothetical protein